MSCFQIGAPMDHLRQSERFSWRKNQGSVGVLQFGEVSRTEAEKDIQSQNCCTDGATTLSFFLSHKHTTWIIY